MHFLGKGFPLKQDNEHKTLKDYLKSLLSHLTWTPSEYLWDTKSEKGNFSRNIQMDYQVFQKCVKSKKQLRSTYIFWRSRCSSQFCQFNKMILAFELKPNKLSFNCTSSMAGGEEKLGCWPGYHSLPLWTISTTFRWTEGKKVFPLVPSSGQNFKLS